MEGRRRLLVLCALAFAFGERMTHDDDADSVSSPRRFHPGLLVRDEPFPARGDSGMNSRKDPRPREAVSVSEQTKDTPARGDQAPGPVVLTKDGKMKGIAVDKAYIFYGIPYADPPVGAYRWKPPRPVTPWAGVYDASFPRAACMQACSGPMAAECPRAVRNQLFLYSICMFQELDLHVFNDLK